MLHTFTLVLSLTRCMAQYRSFIFPESIVSENSITLEKRESHHLVKVFRARIGESVELLDGKGMRYQGRLKEPDARAAVIEIGEAVKLPAPKLKVTLLQALPKGKAMDLILRMASEIGVSSLQPVYTAQSEVRLSNDRAEGKLEKWRATTIEASKQCGLAYLPELEPPVDLKGWLRGNSTGGTGELRLVASLEEGSRLLLDQLSQARLPEQIVLAIGPEGDFSTAEYAALREHDFTPVRLGENVLRAETAVAYMLSVIDQFAKFSRQPFPAE